MILQESLTETGLLLLPRPPRCQPPHHLRFSADIKILRGAVDYRGRIIEPVVLSEIEEACLYFKQKQINHLVVACKFSQRNPALELEVTDFIRDHFPEFEVLASHQASGLLNWVCRANGACYSLATEEACHDFQEKIITTLQQLGLVCPLSILKADGGAHCLWKYHCVILWKLFSGPAVQHTWGGLATTRNG